MTGSPAGRQVLHVVDSLGLGGAQMILKQYFEDHATEGTLHLYALRTVPNGLCIDQPNVMVHPSNARFSFAPLWSLRRIVCGHRIELLHCHLFRSQVMGYLLKRLFFPSIVLVFHEHGRVVGREGESRLEAWLYRHFLRIAAPRVDRFLCISTITRDKLLEAVPAGAARAVVLPNPVPVRPPADARIDRDAARQEFGVPDGGFAVGFASRLVRRKGWADFLDACAQVASEIPAYFLLAGDGEDREAAQRHVRRLGMERRGRLLGHLTRMDRFYASLDCFVIPSHWEPHGLSHLEAQGFGIPVVVSRVPGLADTVNEGTDALLYEAGDVTGLANAIRTLARDADLRARLSAGGVRNAARFTMSAFGSHLEAAYAAAAGATGRRGV